MLKPNSKWFAMAAAVAFGCGGGDGGADAGADAGAAAADDAPAAVAAPAGTAAISGTVSFAGAAPAGTPIDMSDEAACAEKHATAPMAYDVRVGDAGGLGDVFVYVKEGLGDHSFAAPSTPVVLDQDGCEYRPHVLGVMAGQDILIRNSDPVLHNINTQPTTNRGFNVSQPRAGMESIKSFNSAEIMIPVKCDVHGWMTAYIGVTDNPYHATTSADGSFTLSGLPAGDYVIEAWHPTLGASTMSVTVGDAETGTADFSFSEGMAAAVPMGEAVDLLHPEGHVAG
jgi:hypothetical protein